MENDVEYVGCRDEIDIAGQVHLHPEGDVVFPGWAFDAETVVKHSSAPPVSVLRQRHRGSGATGAGDGLVAAATLTTSPVERRPDAGPARRDAALFVAAVGGGGRLRGRLSDQDGVRWRLAGRCFGQMRPNPVLVERLAFVQGDDPMDARPRCARRSRGDVPTTRCAR